MNMNVKKIFDFYLSLNLKYGKEMSRKLIFLEKHNLIVNPNQEVLFKLKVSDDMCNILKTMHGGAIATLIDITTTIAISGLDRDLRQNVSVELSTHYLNSIKNDSEIAILCKVPKIGKTLAYSYAEIYEKDKLLVTGNHIKAMMEKKWDV
jgi:acyl-coenzyme A thioesterase 13